jgi:predicted outer membrane repeat protein
MLAYCPCWPTIINIPADYPTIQQGIDASVDGDTVLIQPGTYVENVNFNGHNIVLGSLFLTTGDTSYISQTVIDGDSSGSVVTIDSGEDTMTILTGFTIRNGYNEWQGGGIYCRQSKPTITNNLITSNLSPNGSGIYCQDAGPILVENVIIGNSTSLFGGEGGGIKCLGDSTPVITNNYIGGNQAVDGGGISCDGNAIILGNDIIGNVAMGFEYMGFSGGISCSHSSAVIAGNTISENSAGRGGGIGCYFSDPSILNNVFHGNQALPGMLPGLGGGIYCYESNPIIMNNCFTGNMADLSGGGIYCELVSNPIITNTIFWANSASYSSEIDFDDSSSPYFTYCDIRGGWPGQGNIDFNPLFRNPANGDFHLMAIACGDSADSPCIDAGDPAILDSLLDCSWGLGGLRSDMGAYGGADSLITAILENQIPTPSRFMLMQNYPNPFTLIDEYKRAGVHTVIFDASGLSSGVYFCRLQAGEMVETRRMVLLK